MTYKHMNLYIVSENLGPITLLNSILFLLFNVKPNSKFKQAYISKTIICLFIKYAIAQLLQNELHASLTTVLPSGDNTSTSSSLLSDGRGNK
jgi:hypothetical protein